MLTQSINRDVCTRALVIVLSAMAAATLVSELVKPAPQRVEAPAPKEEIVHVSYSVDYVPTCSAPVNLMRPPGVDQCTGQARKPGDASELQSSIPLTFRK